jgi:hypothetical protein
MESDSGFDVGCDLAYDAVIERQIFPDWAVAQAR